MSPDRFLVNFHISLLAEIVRFPSGSESRPEKFLIIWKLQILIKSWLFSPAAWCGLVVVVGCSW